MNKLSGFFCGALAAMVWQASLADQTALHMPIGDPERADREVPVEVDTLIDTASADVIAPAELAGRLDDVGLLFIGEQHTNMDFHQVQLRTIQALHAAGREVMIGLEMFPYTQQAALDRWSAGELDEKEFVAQAEWYRYWGYHWGYYRDIFLYARDHGIRMYGVNTPRDVVSAVRKKGFKDLTPEEAAHIPNEVLPATADQRAMFKAFFDADDALHMSESALDGMIRAQTVWDATMGWNALQALEKQGGEEAIMVVLIGSGHVTYGLGAERQTAPYFDGRIASLIPVENRDDTNAPVDSVRASYANFIWGLPKQSAEFYPSLGVSLMGSIGGRPTQIIQVSETSVADRAGLVVGDVLLELGGRAVESSVGLRQIVSEWRWGDVVAATIERDGKPKKIDIAVRRAVESGKN